MRHSGDPIRGALEARLPRAMQPLLEKLNKIQEETGENNNKKGDKGGRGKGDEFRYLKGQIAQRVKDIRTNLKKRDELLQKGASGTKATVQMSHEIRSQLKMVREDAMKLQALQAKEAAKAGKKADAKEQAENRREAVELVFAHIDECEKMEQKRFTGKQAEIRVDLFSGGVRGALGSAMGGRSGGGGGGTSGTELPDIETQEGLMKLQQKNEQIDEQLEVVAEGVQELKSIALTMRDEVKVQTAMVEEIQTKVDMASGHLNKLNKKMKKTLTKTRSADRFIIDFILCVILLGIVGYIISMFTGTQ